MILEMTHVQILGIRSDIQKVVKKLHHLGTLQIDDIHNTPDAQIDELSFSTDTQKIQDESQYLVTQIRGLFESLGCSPSRESSTEDKEISFEEIRSKVNQLTPKIQELNHHKRELTAELEILPRYISTLKKLLPMVPSSASEPGNATVGVLVDVSHIQTLDDISKRILEITNNKAKFVAENVDETMQAMLIIAPRAFTPEIEVLLGQKDVSQLHLPTEYSRLTPEGTLEALNQRVEAIPIELQQAELKLQELAEEWCGRLNCWLTNVEESLEEMDILSKFGETQHTFIIYGWVPKRDFAALKQRLHEEVGDQVFVTEIKLTPETRKLAPIALENPGPVQPFESLVKLRAIPRYDDIDPTSLMALFLPIFFGMMLGDVGYGVLLLALCLWMSRKLKSGFMMDAVKILKIGSIWSIIFGFLYGEAFGTLGEHVGMHAIWIDRTDPNNMMPLLLSFVGVGAVHITLGLIIGVWQAAVHKNRNHLLERGGMLIGVTGLFLLVGTLTNFLPDSITTPSIAVIIVGIALLGASLGKAGMFIGPIEFVGVIGNILSYMRIAAIGLASVYLAQVANDLGGMIGNLIVGALIAVLIHALNLVMGAFSPTIHSMRLHYVEFFRKFYQGGGRPYEPFRNHTPPGTS